MHATDRMLPPGVRRAAAVAGVLLAAVACLAQAPTPGRVLVSDVLIQGNRHVPTETIRHQLKTRPGQEYVPEVMQEDVRALFATKQFGNVYATQHDDGPGKVKVCFHVRDYAQVVERIAYQGAKHLKKDDLDQVTGLRTGMALNPIANKVACRRIEARYHEEGRPFAHCALLKGGDPEDTEVVFQITEGHKVHVRDIAFTGNTFVPSSLLRQRVQSSSQVLGLFGGQFNAALADADVNALGKYYYSFGYHDVRVSREVQWSPDGRDVLLVFHIQEGPRYHLKDVPTVHGVKSLAAEQLEAGSKFKAGDVYDQRKVDADLARIKDSVGYTGREVRRAEAVPFYPPDSPGVVNVHYRIEEAAPAKVGQVIIIGNDRTRQNVILRQIPLYPGQTLTYPDLRIAERNLARLGIFETSPDGAVRPTVVAQDSPLDPSSPYKDIIVNVQEANTGSLLFGVGVNSDAGLTGSIVLNERNFDWTRVPTSFEDFLNGTAFRGAGQEFRLEAVPGTQLQRYTVSFREPFLFDSPYSLGLSGYYYQRYFNEYSEERLGGRVTVGRKLNDYWSVAGTFRAENVRVGDVSVFAPVDYQEVRGDNTLVGFRAGVTRDSRDSFLRPTQGSLLDLSFEEVVGTRTFPLFNADYTKYWTTYQRPDGSGKHVLALHSQFGWAGANTPVYERFFGGGFRSIRGFQFRGVGPDVNGFKVGGTALILNSLEYQVPVRASDNIFLVGFVDTGTVARRLDEIDDYRVSAGFGLRLKVPMLGEVPIALDFGFPIVKGPRDDEQIFNFWMGFFR